MGVNCDDKNRNVRTLSNINRNIKQYNSLQASS